jgi:hypothetical protein
MPIDAACNLFNSFRSDMNQPDVLLDYFGYERSPNGATTLSIMTLLSIKGLFVTLSIKSCFYTDCFIFIVMLSVLAPSKPVYSEFEASS